MRWPVARRRQEILLHEHLLKVLHYDPETGLFYNRYTRSSHSLAGGVACHKSGHYQTVCIEKRHYLAHRLVWFWVHKEWPMGIVDHINGNPMDNRIVNLRDCSQSSNVFHALVRKSKRGGPHGISSKSGKWEASIKVFGKNQYLGRFSSQEEAQAAYWKAANSQRPEDIAIIIPSAVTTAATHPDPRTFVKVLPRRKSARPTAERLRAIIHYDPESGQFTWRVTRQGAKAKSGQIAGMILKEWGYRRIKVDGMSCLAHHLAWLYVTGEWPTSHVDHLNCVPADNRFANLRLADHSQSASNRRMFSTSKSSFKGIYRNGRGWSASVRMYGKSHYLGIFSTPEEAHAAYAAAARELHGEFARTE